MLEQLNDEQRRHFRDKLRDARGAAQRDAEGFQQIVHVLEHLGGFLRRDSSGLGSALPALHQIARRSPLAEDMPEMLREFHTPFEILYRQVKDGRNDAFHEGAVARHLAGDAVILAMVLEDALMSDAKVIGDFMIRRPQCAELWQPLSFIRQIMLVNSFSHLPVNTAAPAGHRWRLVSDVAVAKFTRTRTKRDRVKRLRMSVGEASDNGLHLMEAQVCSADASVEEVLTKNNGLPILVTDKEHGRLIGFATPFDLL